MQHLNLQIIQDQSRVSERSSSIVLIIVTLRQRESGVSPDLGRSSAMYMATELFIKPSGVIEYISLYIFII